MRWRFPSRAELSRRRVSIAVALLVSLTIWALMLVARTALAEFALGQMAIGAKERRLD